MCTITGNSERLPGRGCGVADMAKWKSGRVDRMRMKGSKDPYMPTEKLPGDLKVKSKMVKSGYGGNNSKGIWE